MRTHTNTLNRRPRLAVQPLEGRDLMSVTSVALSAGTLQVVADNAPDYIQVRQIANVGGSVVTVKDLTATTNNSWSFNAANVQRIVVKSNGGNDHVDSNAAAPTTVWGGDGNDLIITGAGSDAIFAGAGNDSVHAGAGNDKLYGDSGINRLYGEAGNDSLFAGSRPDFVDGGVGYDYLELFSGQVVAVNGENVKIRVPQDQPQTDGWSCGPNSGSRFLRSYGINVSYSTLRSQVQENNLLSKFHLGTLPTTLRDVVKNYKSDLTLETGANRDHVLQLLAQGKPVIALVAVKKVDIEKFGLKVGTYGLLHYVVLNGFDQATGTIRYVDTTGEAKTWSFAEFSKRSSWVDYFSGVGVPMKETLHALGMRDQTILF